MTLRRRLIGTFGASALGPLVTILVQLVNVPVMLHYWGAHLYGEWLLISAIPAYLVLTDLGFGTAAGSDMTMRVNAGDSEGAIEIFQSITLLVLFVSLLLGLLFCGAIFLLPIHRILHFSSMSPREARIALLFVCLNALVSIQWGSITAAYRCAGKYMLLVLSLNVMRLLEGMSFLILLVWRAGPVQLSMLMLAISLVGTIWLLFTKKRLIPWLPYGVRHAKWRCVRELWRSAISFLAFPTGGVASVQGMTMMVGLVLGPLGVAVFNPMRTLSRPAFLLTDAIKNSVWQELSAAYGQGNWDLARKLHRTACQASLWLALFICIGLAFCGQRIFALWTHGRVVMDVPAFYFLLGVVLINSVWNTSSAVPLAGNRHQRLAVVYLVCTSVSLFIAYPLILYLGLKGAGVALIMSEFVMAIYVVRLSNKLLSDQRSAFAASMLDASQFRILLGSVIRRFV